MILRTLIVVCAVFISPSLGKLSLSRFADKFEKMCFQKDDSDPFRVNGQETPLSNTLENFIALAEKFEIANPSIKLREELAYFISEYLFENIKFTNKLADQWKLGRAEFDKIDAMWDPEKVFGQFLNFEDPFTDDEKCSLYYMISHSILSEQLMIARSFIPTNYSSDVGGRNIELDPKDFLPQELGVVAIRGTDAAVSLSKVLLGLFVGLRENRKATLDSFNLEDPNQQLQMNRIVDALYSVTMADVLMQSKWSVSDRPGLAPNGKWISIPINTEKKIDGFCPMVYQQQQQTKTNDNYMPAYSYSSVRGAADGLILGLAALPVNQKKDSARLSQLLRMYYSPDGITLDSPLEDINDQKISFCNRQSLMASVEPKLKEQMELYGYLIDSTFKIGEQSLNNAINLYNNEKRLIFDNANTELRDYCQRPTSLDRPEDLPRETFLDIIVVMDSKNSENSFQDQQLIVGYLAKYLDLRYSGSRMTILLDEKISGASGSGTSSKIQLKTVVLDTYSSSCAACTVGQLPYVQSRDTREDIIVGIDQFLEERRENETKYSGANGKVVVYFNYENDGVRANNKMDTRLEIALQNLHLNHREVIFYAVGLDTDILKKYAKNDPSLTFLGTDGTPEEVAKKIYTKISFAPALLQYEDCEHARSEKSAVYENFVSPHTIQHYQMPAEYFYKSRSLSFFFEAQNGYIRVCHNRATAKPENEIKNCQNTTGNGGNPGIKFELSNPCKSFTKETCAPFYFSVMGMDSNNHEMRPDNRNRDFCTDTKDQWCRTLDQVKFKAYHLGVRCSGCLGLGVPQVLILLTTLLTYILHKKF